MVVHQVFSLIYIDLSIYVTVYQNYYLVYPILQFLSTYTYLPFTPKSIIKIKVLNRHLKFNKVLFFNFYIVTKPIKHKDNRFPTNEDFLSRLLRDLNPLGGHEKFNTTETFNFKPSFKP